MTFRTQIHKKKCFRTLQGTMSHRPLTNTSSLKIAAAYSTGCYRNIRYELTNRELNRLIQEYQIWTDKQGFTSADYSRNMRYEMTKSLKQGTQQDDPGISWTDNREVNRLLRNTKVELPNNVNRVPFMLFGNIRCHCCRIISINLRL